MATLGSKRPGPHRTNPTYWSANFKPFYISPRPPRVLHCYGLALIPYSKTSALCTSEKLTPKCAESLASRMGIRSLQRCLHLLYGQQLRPRCVRKLPDVGSLSITFHPISYNCRNWPWPQDRRQPTPPGSLRCSPYILHRPSQPPRNEGDTGR